MTSITRLASILRLHSQYFELHSQYFELQEEMFYIQNDQKYWVKYGIADYEGMVKRVNTLSPVIRTIARKIYETNK